MLMCGINVFAAQWWGCIFELYCTHLNLAFLLYWTVIILSNENHWTSVEIMAWRKCFIMQKIIRLRTSCFKFIATTLSWWRKFWNFSGDKNCGRKSTPFEKYSNPEVFVVIFSETPSAFLIKILRKILFSCFERIRLVLKFVICEIQTY